MNYLLSYTCRVRDNASIEQFILHSFLNIFDYLNTVQMIYGFDRQQITCLMDHTKHLT